MEKTNYFFEATCTTAVVLREHMDIKSAKLTTLKAGGPIHVDRRTGGALPGWSMVKVYKIDGDAVKTIVGYVQTKYFQH